MEKRIGPLLRIPQEALSLVSWVEEAKVLHRVASLGAQWDTIKKHLDNVNIQIRSVTQSFNILSRYSGDEKYVTIREFARELVKDREHVATTLRRKRSELITSLESSSSELMHFADMNLHFYAEGVQVSPQLASRKNYLYRVETCLAKRVSKIVEDCRQNRLPGGEDDNSEDVERLSRAGVKRRSDAVDRIQYNRPAARRRTQSKDPILASTSSESPQEKTQELMRSLIDAAVTSAENGIDETESPPDVCLTPSDADLRSSLLQ